MCKCRLSPSWWWSSRARRPGRLRSRKGRSSRPSPGLSCGTPEPRTLNTFSAPSEIPGTTIRLRTIKKISFFIGSSFPGCDKTDIFSSAIEDQIPCYRLPIVYYQSRVNLVNKILQVAITCTLPKHEDIELKSALEGKSSVSLTSGRKGYWLNGVSEAKSWLSNSSFHDEAVTPKFWICLRVPPSPYLPIDYLRVTLSTNLLGAGWGGAPSVRSDGGSASGIPRNRTGRFRVSSGRWLLPRSFPISLGDVIFLLFETERPAHPTAIGLDVLNGQAGNEPEDLKGRKPDI